MEQDRSPMLVVPKSTKEAYVLHFNGTTIFVPVLPQLKSEVAVRYLSGIVQSRSFFR